MQKYIAQNLKSSVSRRVFVVVTEDRIPNLGFFYDLEESLHFSFDVGTYLISTTRNRFRWLKLNFEPALGVKYF